MSVIGKMSVQSEQEFNNTYDKGLESNSKCSL
jgi:hypothetical protein